MHAEVVTVVAMRVPMLPSVVGLGEHFEMQRVDASLVEASVVDFGARWHNSADGQLIGQDVGEDVAAPASSSSDHAVGRPSGLVLDASGQPGPALVVCPLVDFGPEPFLKSWHVTHPKNTAGWTLR